jgi:hypothetical protein
VSDRVYAEQGAESPSAVDQDRLHGVRLRARPFFVWLVARLKYDRRALTGWTLLAWLLVLVCYFLMPPPPAPPDAPNMPVNINYVHGFGHKPQQMMPPLVYLGLMMLVLPTCIYWPAHWVLNRLWGRRGDARAETTGA